MADRRAFYSFHYEADYWRAAQVRNMGVIEGNAAVSDNDWESIKKGGDSAVQRWIDGQLDGKSCTVVLIGTNTAGRKWINREIIKTWNDEKGIVGIYIHNLQDKNQYQSPKGSNPFEEITLGSGGKRLSTILKAYDPPYGTSKDVYSYIKTNLLFWIEEAITIRSRY